MNFRRGRIFSFGFLIFFVALLANFGTCLQDTGNLKNSEEKTYPYPNVILPFIRSNTEDEGLAAHFQKRGRGSEVTEKDAQPRSSSSDNSNAKYYYIGGGVLIIIVGLVIAWCCFCRQKKKGKVSKKAFIDLKNPQTVATLHLVPPHAKPMNTNSPAPISGNPFTSPSGSGEAEIHAADVHVVAPLEASHRVQQEDNSPSEVDEFPRRSSSESSSGTSGNVKDEGEPPYFLHSADFYSSNEKETKTTGVEAPQKEIKEEFYDSGEKFVEKSAAEIYNSNKVDSLKKVEDQFTSTVTTDHNPAHNIYVSNELEETGKNPTVMQKAIHEKEESFEKDSGQFTIEIPDIHNPTFSYVSDDLVETDKGPPTVIPKPEHESNMQKVDSLEKHEGHKNDNNKYYPYRLEHMSSKPDIKPKPLYQIDASIDSHAADSINNPDNALEPYIPKPVDGDIRKIADKHKLFALYALNRMEKFDRDPEHETNLENIEPILDIPSEYEPSRRHVHRRYSLESLHEREVYNRSHTERYNPKVDPYMQVQREKFNSIERYIPPSSERYDYPDKRVYNLPRQERYVSPDRDPHIHSRNERYKYSENEKYGSLERDPNISRVNRSQEKYGSLERAQHIRQDHPSQNEKYGSLERDPYIHSRNERYNFPDKNQDNRFRAEKYDDIHNQFQKQRYNSSENETHISSQKLRRYSLERDSHNQSSVSQPQSRYDHSFDQMRERPYDPPSKHKENLGDIPYNRGIPPTQKPRYPERDSYDKDRHKHNYSERIPPDYPQKPKYYERELSDRPQKTGYHFEKSSFDRSRELQERNIISHSRDASSEIKNYDKKGYSYEKDKYNDDRHKNEAHNRNISDRKINRPTIKPKDDISIPEPDYMTRDRKDLEQFKSSLQEKLDSRPPVASKPEAKNLQPQKKSRGDFKRPYSLEDLDEMNNPLTIAIRVKPQRPSPYSYTNPE